jgi:hypothetical protein
LPNPSIILREFKYFDRQIVEDFLSSIEGGLATESKVSEIRKGSRVGAEAGISLLKVKGEKATQDVSNEETKTMGNAALFQRLYVALEMRHMININVEEQAPEQGDIFELEGNIELPFFENISEISRQINPLLLSQQPDANRDTALSILAQNQTVNVRIVSGKKNNQIIAVIQKRNLRVPIQELADNYKGLYRIKRVLKPNETFDVFKLPIKLSDEMISGLLKNLSNMPVETLLSLGINKQPSREDFQVKSPAIVLTPIAIYQ